MLEQKNKTRARVRLAVFLVLSVHVVGLMALLMQGCRKPPEPETVPTADTNVMVDPTMYTDTNAAITSASNSVPVPPYNTTTPLPGPGAPMEYTVMKGDSFYTIIFQYAQQHQYFIRPIGMTLYNDLAIQDIGHRLIAFII